MSSSMNKCDNDDYNDTIETGPSVKIVDDTDISPGGPRCRSDSIDIVNTDGYDYTTGFDYGSYSNYGTVVHNQVECENVVQGHVINMDIDVDTLEACTHAAIVVSTENENDEVNINIQEECNNHVDSTAIMSNCNVPVVRGDLIVGPTAIGAARRQFTRNSNGGPPSGNSTLNTNAMARKKNYINSRTPLVNHNRSSSVLQSKNWNRVCFGLTIFGLFSEFFGIFIPLGLKLGLILDLNYTEQLTGEPSREEINETLESWSKSLYYLCLRSPLFTLSLQHIMFVASFCLLILTGILWSPKSNIIMVDRLLAPKERNCLYSSRKNFGLILIFAAIFLILTAVGNVLVIKPTLHNSWYDIDTDTYRTNHNKSESSDSESDSSGANHDAGSDSDSHHNGRKVRSASMIDNLLAPLFTAIFQNFVGAVFQMTNSGYYEKEPADVVELEDEFTEGEYDL